jgi:hypothetical protein
MTRLLRTHDGRRIRRVVPPTLIDARDRALELSGGRRL